MDNVKKLLFALIIGLFTLSTIGCSGDKDKTKTPEKTPKTPEKTT